MASNAPSVPPIQSLQFDSDAALFNAHHSINAFTSPQTIERQNTSSHSTVTQRTTQDMPPQPSPQNGSQTSQSQDHNLDEGSAGGEEEDTHSTQEGSDDEHDEDEHDAQVSNSAELSSNDLHDPYPWIAICEDTTIPCDDEMAYIKSREEHSALDHPYWEKQTFLDLKDPELVPGANGRIDWVVERFNGTKEQPNRQLVMLSPTVKIGGFEWRIKFYPKGNRTDFLSVYVDCATMHDLNFVDQRDFVKMPIPRLAGTPPIKQRISVAAQVCVVMYNPSEPRVHEHKIDAYQYHKSAPDFGWKFFSQEPRPSFHLRKHGQRQAMLKGDRLAFTAYVRIVADPTGCLWKPKPAHPDTSIFNTSLRPLEGMSAQTATAVMLLHLRFFRRWLESTRSKRPEVTDLRQILLRALCRRLKQRHLKAFNFPDGCDVVEVLTKLCAKLKPVAPDDASAGLHHMFAFLTDPRQYISHNRLATRGCSSLQQALNKVESRHGKQPPVLLIEIERQLFSESSRSWSKIRDAVKLDDFLQYGSRRYSLYGFVTHRGPLGSGEYAPFVRPAGPNTLWYVYDANEVRCLTQTSAHLRSLGVNPTSQRPATSADHASAANMQSRQQDHGVAYLAWYIRDDHGQQAYSTALEETFPVHDLISNSVQAVESRSDSLCNRDQKRPNVKTTTAPPAEQMSALRSTLNDAAQSATNPTQVDLMDGDDVIMSDTEEGHSEPMLLNRSMCSNNSHTKDPMPQPQSTEQTTRKILSFFCGDCYHGEVLADNTYHGYGRLIRTNGDMYRGQFIHGQPHGRGRMLYSKDGDVYDGEWSQGQHHGQGRFTEQRTGNVYEGGWKHGLRHGAFVLRGTVTEDDKHCCQICYENAIDTAFYDCGHALTCKECAKAVTECPVCRKHIVSRLQLFGVKISMH